MVGDSSPVGSPIREDNPLGDDDRVPVAFSGNHPCETAAPIGGLQESVHVDQLGFDLDEQECPRRMVPGDDVNDAALAEVVERGLGSKLPTGSSEHDRDTLRHGGVPAREDAFDPTATPASLER